MKLFHSKATATLQLGCIPFYLSLHRNQ